MAVMAAIGAAGTAAMDRVTRFREAEVADLLTLVAGRRVVAAEVAGVQGLLAAAGCEAKPGRKAAANVIWFRDRYLVYGRVAVEAGGVVLAALDAERNEPVAVKYAFRPFLTPAMVRAFRRETVLLERLRHPGIIRQRDFGEAETGDLYQVLEWAPGGDLTAWLEQVQDPPWWERIAALVVTAEALAVVHEKGIVHGDVKPTNILIGADGSAVLADWRSVSIDRGGQEPGLVPCRGTFEYLGRRGKLGKAPGRVDDLYALGLTLAQVVAGPVVGVMGGTKKVLGEPRGLMEMEQMFPTEVVDLLGRALLSGDTGGFSDALQLARAMVEVVRGRRSQLGSGERRR